ncbi:MAG TPA: preprotein translocase subunit SecE [Solirubrobacteraceae bacterium]|nr:preprotein translocase subunit SecE [Solirubrobacteraceae bacterium]
MARDRQRAKQRKARRGISNPGPALSKPRRTDVPGELDHVSGEVDEFEAAMLAGAEGPDGQPALAEEQPSDYAEEQPSDYAEDALEEDRFDDAQDALEEDLEEPAGRSGGAVAIERPRTGAPTPGRGPGRWLAFLRASWAELQRVQWPDRRQVAQATGVVLGFVIIAGVYLGVADQLAQKLVNAIL